MQCVKGHGGRLLCLWCVLRFQQNKVFWKRAAHLLAGGASDGGSEDEVALLAVLEDVLDGLPVRLQRDGGGEDPRRR